MTAEQITATQDEFKAMAQDGLARVRRVDAAPPAGSRVGSGNNLIPTTVPEGTPAKAASPDPATSVPPGNQGPDLKDLHARLNSLLEEVAAVQEKLRVVREKVKALGVIKEGW
jgi:hypothetical protein